MSSVEISLVTFSFVQITNVSLVQLNSIDFGLGYFNVVQFSFDFV